MTESVLGHSGGQRNLFSMLKELKLSNNEENGTQTTQLSARGFFSSARFATLALLGVTRGVDEVIFVCFSPRSDPRRAVQG